MAQQQIFQKIKYQITLNKLIENFISLETSNKFIHNKMILKSIINIIADFNKINIKEFYVTQDVFNDPEIRIKQHVFISLDHAKNIILSLRKKSGIKLNIEKLIVFSANKIYTTKNKEEFIQYLTNYICN